MPNRDKVSFKINIFILYSFLFNLNNFILFPDVCFVLRIFGSYFGYVLFFLFSSIKL